MSLSNNQSTEIATNIKYNINIKINNNNNNRFRWIILKIQADIKLFLN